MKKIIASLIIVLALISCPSCTSTQKQKISDIVNQYPDELSFAVKTITKIVIKETKPSKNDLEQAEKFLVYCKELAKNPSEFSLEQLKLLAGTMDNGPGKLIVLNILNFADRYINTSDSNSDNSKLIIIICDSAIEAIHNHQTLTSGT